MTKYRIGRWRKRGLERERKGDRERERERDEKTCKNRNIVESQ